MKKRGTRAGRGVSAALVEQHADELFGLITSGLTIKQACGSDPKFSLARIFAVQIRINPGIRARYLKVKSQWRLNRSPSGRFFARIITLIESGMSIAEACATDPAFPNPNRFCQVMIHPECGWRARSTSGTRTRNAGPPPVEFPKAVRGVYRSGSHSPGFFLTGQKSQSNGIQT